MLALRCYFFITRLPDPVIQTSPDTEPDKTDELNITGGHAEWMDFTYRMNGEFKEFHLVAEPVVRELGPGMTANFRLQGQSPGLTIEVVEGDKIRIFLTNNYLNIPAFTGMVNTKWYGW